MTPRSPSEIDDLVAEIGRHGLGGLNPDAEQVRALVAADRDGPLQFVNLLGYHAVARYPAGHELAGKGLSGADAYGLYGLVALEHVTRRGGRLVLYNDVEQLVIGRGAAWDQVAIMEYPNTDAFIDMISDPEYQTGLVHRDAGLADTVVLVTRSLLP
ncbi:MAG: DUF1330 domain-containing protein [Acidimicrobiia bacterium]